MMLTIRRGNVDNLMLTIEYFDSIFSQRLVVNIIRLITHHSSLTSRQSIQRSTSNCQHHKTHKS